MPKAPSLPPPLKSGKSHATALALCVTLGSFGAHRYYLGRHLSGTLQLLSTLLCLAAGGYAAFISYAHGQYVNALLAAVAIMVLMAVWPLIDFWLLNTNRLCDSRHSLVTSIPPSLSDTR